MTKNKYKAIKTVIDGIIFDSKKESARYQVLKCLEKGNKIRNLELQPVYIFELNGKKIFKYIADFRYFDVAQGKLIIEDVKGVRTPVFNLKKKIIENEYGIVIEII